MKGVVAFSSHTTGKIYVSTIGSSLIDMADKFRRTICSRANDMSRAIDRKWLPLLSA